MGSRKRMHTKRPMTLAQLMQRHADVDEQLQLEMRRLRPDDIVVSRCKKLKLMYKERITAMQRAQDNDVSPRTPVSSQNDDVEDFTDLPKTGDVINFHSPRHTPPPAEMQLELKLAVNG